MHARILKQKLLFTFLLLNTWMDRTRCNLFTRFDLYSRDGYTGKCTDNKRFIVAEIDDLVTRGLPKCRSCNTSCIFRSNRSELQPVLAFN